MILILMCFQNNLFSQTNSGPAISVSIWIFSGRPNPVISITDNAKIEEIKNMLTGLPKTEKPPLWSKLGYNGFVLSNNDIPDFADKVRVFQGVIKIRNDSNISYFKDIKGLESWLKIEAKEQGIPVE